jgi:hypothetical protein
MKKIFLFIIVISNLLSLVAMKRPYPEPYNTRGAQKRMQEERKLYRQQKMKQAIQENDIEEARILLLCDAQLVTKENVRNAIEQGRSEILSMLKENDHRYYTDYLGGSYQDGFTPLSLAYALKLRIRVQSDEREKLMQHMRQLSTLQARELGECTDCITSTIDLIDARDKIIEIVKTRDLVGWQKDLFWAMQQFNQEAQHAMLMFIRQVHDEEEQECRQNNNGNICGYHEEVILPMLESILQDFQRLYQERKYVINVHNYALFFTGLVIHTYEEILWDDVID